jgi:hypothetical protein
MLSSPSPRGVSFQLAMYIHSTERNRNRQKTVGLASQCLTPLHFGCWVMRQEKGVREPFSAIDVSACQPLPGKRFLTPFSTPRDSRSGVSFQLAIIDCRLAGS